jgi:predicted nucleic acid binding AN1-type Zn finger protein
MPCATCGNRLAFMYICPKCGKTFCRDHKEPYVHYCGQPEYQNVKSFTRSCDY